jgi:hypothetical protein
MTTQQKINSLKPGRSMMISGNDDAWVTVERSGDGKTVRYVRHTPDSFMVFRTVAF